MLRWERPGDDGVLRAYDEHAMYVILRDDAGRYLVGFFPSPGPVCRWGEAHETVEGAKLSAEDCAAHVTKVWGSLGGSNPRSS